jgi:hypothetical protein
MLLICNTEVAECKHGTCVDVAGPASGLETAVSKYVKRLNTLSPYTGVGQRLPQGHRQLINPRN